MVKVREPKANEATEPTAEEIEAFAAEADLAPGETVKRELDPQAPHNFKAICVNFNEYEYNQLVIGAKLADRKPLDFLRRAMLDTSKELQKNIPS
jgi:hypothetical protein